MLTAIFALLIIPFIILFTIGIPIIVGVVVYRDANKRVDCNPWLWSLIAALIPSFIGVVIYVIVRRDYPLKSENRMAGEDPDDEEESYYQKNYDNMAVENKSEKSGIPTWAKVIIIIIAALLILWLAAIVIATIKYMFGYGAYVDFGMGMGC